MSGEFVIVNKAFTAATLFNLAYGPGMKDKIHHRKWIYQT